MKTVGHNNNKNEPCCMAINPAAAFCCIMGIARYWKDIYRRILYPILISQNLQKGYLLSLGHMHCQTLQLEGYIKGYYILYLYPRGRQKIYFLSLFGEGYFGDIIS
jgi:hypothetical protein